jgi:hypothetical protein
MMLLGKLTSFILSSALWLASPLVRWRSWQAWPAEVVSLAGAPKGRFGSETQMEAARERCCVELTEEGELLCGVPTHNIG